MWWNDLIDVKKSLSKLSDRMCLLERAILELSQNVHEEGIEKKMEDLKECVSTFLYSDDDYSPINRIHDKLDELLADSERRQAVVLAQKTLDKFEDYMKNVDKLNILVNEFKGCVSMARGAIAERKGDSCEREEFRYKIDFIYENVAKIAQKLQKCEKKSRKPRKKRRKRTIRVPES